ncbi:MAG: MSEP-CTERM sorting domain-containing protein [Kiritimatiellaeota bacterium]|nr:MSEP-CTERM sorting domain-containing protein [Kiritimatiellota bacterium]
MKTPESDRAESKNHDDLRAVFANPWVWLVTHGVFPLLALSSAAYCAWLLWGDLGAEGRTLFVVAIAVPAVMAALSIGVTFLYRRRPIPLWMSIFGAVVGIAYLFGYFSCKSMLIPAGTPSWMVSPSYTLLVFAGMMPLILTDIWRIATMPLPLSPTKDKVISIASTVGVPVLSFIFLQTFIVTSAFGNAKFIIYPLAILLLVSGPILFFFAFFRSMMWIRLWFKSRNAKHSAWSAIIVTSLVALVLPLAGLWLNSAIPFPADFQTPWVYALTVVNAAILLLGVRGGSPTLPIFLLRWLTFPFTLYFFLVFLPFFPLSILAMIAVGLGFLILAPVLLFWHHVTILAHDWRNVALPRLQKLLLALLAVAVIPGVIFTNAYLDRVAFHKLLDYAFSPDITQDATLPTSPARIRRILEKADAFKNSNETPILSAIYTQIVFDGLVLPDERFNFMWDCYVGEERKNETEGSRRNEFGSLFSRNDARGRAISNRWRVSPPRNAVLESGEVQVAVSTNGYEQTVTLRLHLTATDSQQQEFYAPVTLPAATWVTGMRLKIDGEWADASIIERRAAEWVYKQITVVQRKDPAILTLDTPERGLLRVFPVSSDLPRDLEITFLQPAGMYGEIEIGNKIFDFKGQYDLLKDPICAGDTVFSIGLSSSTSAQSGLTTHWSGIDEDGKRTGGTIYHVSFPSPELIVIDSSVKGIPFEKMQEMLRGVHIMEPWTNIVLSVNAETKTTLLFSEMYSYPAVQASALLPNQFGLDAVRALRQIDYYIRNTGVDRPAPVLFIGDQWETSLLKYPPQDYMTRYYGYILKSDGTIIKPDDDALMTSQTDESSSRNRKDTIYRTYPPGSLEGEGLLMGRESFTRLYPESCTPTYPDDLLWTQGAQLWKLQQDCYDHGTLNQNFRQILSESSRLGILVPQTAYIVVETEAQRKMLAVKQAEAANAHQALDFDYDSTKTDAPSLLILAIAVLLAFALRGWGSRRLQKR